MTTPKAITEDEYHMNDEESQGFCRHCGEFTTGECEPDAREYKCEECGRLSVFGTQEALMMGLISIK